MTARRAILLLLCIIGLFLWNSTDVFGQPGNGGDPDQVPITGIEYLIGGGIAYGIRSLIKGRKKKGD